MTIAKKLNIKTFPFEIKDDNGRIIYREDSNGDWVKFEYAQHGYVIYCERSDGYILDKRPKPEPEPVKKQTAVEWLYGELSKNHISNDSIKSRIDKEEEIWKQSKAMEKEQIIEAYLTPLSNEYWFQKDEILNQESEKYYNETYGGDK
jgi:hypothetical protein